MCAGEWKRHNQKTLFRDYTVADWTDSLQHTKKWIDANQKIRSKRIVTGKRKRTPEVPTPTTAASASAAIPPPSDLPASASDSNDNDTLPELGDMLRDCQQMQRALTRLINNIQKYIAATSD